MERSRVSSVCSSGSYKESLNEFRLAMRTGSTINSLSVIRDWS